MPSDPNTLIAQANCVDCKIPDGMKVSVFISLALKVESSSSFILTEDGGYILQENGSRILQE